MGILKQKINFQSNILFVITDLNYLIEEALEPLQDADVFLNLTSDGENYIITFAGRQIFSTEDCTELSWYNSPSKESIRLYLITQMKKVIGDLCVVADKVTEL